MAHASGAELETQLELAARLGLVADDEFARLTRDLQEIGKMLNGLVKSVKRRLLIPDP